VSAPRSRRSRTSRSIPSGRPRRVRRSARWSGRQQYGTTGGAVYTNREPEEIATFFDGLEWFEQGFVSVSLWRPDRPMAVAPVAAIVDEYGGLARKP